MKKILIAATVSLISLATPAVAQNIVTNGNFENAGLTGWTGSGWGTNINGIISGAFSASTGCVGDACIHDSLGGFNTAGGAFLYQDLATVAGSTYNIEFDFGAAGFTNELAVTFGGLTAFDGVNLSSDNLHYSFTNLLATGSTTRLTFFGRQDPSYDRLDNVSVVLSATGAVPEPATWSMMIAGFGVIGAGARYRRRNAKVAFA